MREEIKQAELRALAASGNIRENVDADTNEYETRRNNRHNRPERQNHPNPQLNQEITDITDKYTKEKKDEIIPV